jgi:hypothetical protein
LLSDTSTNLTMPDVRNINGELSLVNGTRQKLRVNLNRFLNEVSDYVSALRVAIPLTRQHYAESPY